MNVSSHQIDVVLAASGTSALKPEHEACQPIRFGDEAGIGSPTDEPISIVAAVIVHGDQQLAKVRNSLKRLADMYIPPEQREGFVFHAEELFNGGGKAFNRQNGLPLPKRLEIAREIAAIPAATNGRSQWAGASDRNS